MNLARLAAEAKERGQPVRAGLIGAGKFGSMFLNQVPTTPGLEVAMIADLSPDRARAALAHVGWGAADIDTLRFTDDGLALCADPEVEVVVDESPSPSPALSPSDQLDRARGPCSRLTGVHRGSGRSCSQAT